MFNSKKLIMSLTTVPERFDMLKQAVGNLRKLSGYEIADKLYINVDDNLKNKDLKKYDIFKDGKTEVKICPAKWRSCNKLIWVYKENPDAIITTWDDDKLYPKECLMELLHEYALNPECIIAQEVNPVRMSSNYVQYINIADIKLKQTEWGKYLSNACLFPPNCFTDLLYDYDKMMHITNGCHDELWFWIVSSLNGVQCIGLDNTFSYVLEENVNIQNDKSKLTGINSKKEVIDEYNDKLSKMFGEQLLKAFNEKPVIFTIDSPLKAIAFRGQLDMINALYNQFKITVRFKGLARSWVVYCLRAVNQKKWFGEFKFSIS